MIATSRKAPAYVTIVDDQGNPVSIGDGDMKKSVYDTNDNGIVDRAENIDWSGIENKPQMTSQADSTATDVEGMVTDFNSLLAKLKAAGFMA